MQVTELEKQVDADCMQQLKEAAERQQDTVVSPSKRQKVVAAAAVTQTELAQRIEYNMNEIIKLSEEKMNRAQQIYDYIDMHIRKLDKDLKSFDAEIVKDRQKLGLPVLTTAAPAGSQDQSKRSKRKEAAPPTAEELYQAALAVADESEPTYCICNRISFGEMIACEHPECPTEWFHFQCVGLTPENRPKGKLCCFYIFLVFIA